MQENKDFSDEETIFNENPNKSNYDYIIKIPKDRIAVLIGTKGEVKKSLEEDSSCEINVDSKEGEVNISSKDSLKLFSLKEVIRAIARGFNPELAKLLLKQDYGLEIINLNEYNDHKSHQLRLKGRVIGRKGKSRESIEELTNCYISVYGKTISILGPVVNIPLARKAVESLLMGSMHATVYKWLEKQKSDE
jgi:ribosomal RNA assembly protein